ncbi:MAG: AgmX/PglI C-terminal domain-containing protein, partial [Polyangia bacterium]
DGGARVVAKGHDPVLLAKNDRTMVAPKLPPLTTRAPKPAAASAKKPAPAPAAKPAASATPPAAPVEEGDLDKDKFRNAVRGTLGDVKGCYETALETNDHLAGKFVVRMNVVTENGVGRIADGEVVPGEGDMNEPALQQCILLALSRATFPPSADGEPVVVDYPFILLPE